MITIYRTDVIEKFRVYSNEYSMTYVYVPTQPYVVSRKILPNYIGVIKSGWYRKEDIDPNKGIPKTPWKCKPVIEEEKNVFINSYETHNENWVHFNDSNFMKSFDDNWYCYEFMEDSENRITEIDVFNIGTVEIKTLTNDWAIIPKNNTENDINEVMKRVSYAIENYPFFMVNDNEMIFFSENNGDQFKI